MGKGEVRKYYNPKFYPLGPAISVGAQRTIVARVEADDAKLWADKPGYQELMGSKISEMNKAKKEVTNVCRVV